jgi:anti-sigma B factor antagonist
LVSSSTLKDRIREQLQDRRTLFVIDCQGLNFINSSGLGALISALKDVRLSGGDLALCGLTPYVDEIFEITGLKRVFRVCKDVDEASTSFDSIIRERAEIV